jgi:uncharacterized membrane protein
MIVMKIVYVVVVVCFLLFMYKLCKKQEDMCYTTKYDMVEDGVTEHASEGNPGG